MASWPTRRTRYKVNTSPSRRAVGIGLGHLAVKLAQMGGAQAEGRQAEARRADPFRARNSIRQRSLPERTMANLPVRSSARM
jgi:hypothetical protein